MNIHAAKSEITKFACDLLVVSIFKNEIPPSGQARGRHDRGEGVVDKALGGLLGQEIKERHFEGEAGEMFTIHTHGKIAPKRVAVVGLGERKDFDLESVRRAAAKVVRTVRGTGIKTIGTELLGAGVHRLSPRDLAQALAEGALDRASTGAAFAPLPPLGERAPSSETGAGAGCSTMRTLKIVRATCRRMFACNCWNMSYPSRLKATSGSTCA